MLRFLFFSLISACFASLIYLNLIIVPEGNIAFLKDRVKGWESIFLEPGYHWIWTGFIPNQWKIYFIPTVPVSLKVEFSAPLRYTKYLQLPDTFESKIQMKIKYQVNKEKIRKNLFSLNEKINGMDNYIQEKINIIIQLRYFEFYQTDRDIPFLEARFNRYIQTPNNQNSFALDWKKVFDEDGIELVKYNLIKIYIPDYNLYTAHLRNLDQYIIAKRKAFFKSLEAQAEAKANSIKNRAELEKAEKVLNLIGRDPRILEYLKYENLNPKTTVIRIEREGNSFISPLSVQSFKQKPQFSQPEKKSTEGDENQGGLAQEEEVGQIGPITR